MKQNIRFLKNSQIDFDAWDNCVENSVNGLPYAFTDHLDIVSEDWGGLVYADYEAVMPITSKVKFGIKYIAQPLFSQQLGVFSRIALSDELVKSFIECIPKIFFVADIQLNSFNQIEQSGILQRQRTNFQIDLINSYERISSKYSKNCKRNLDSAKRNSITIRKNSLTVNEFIEFYRDNLQRFVSFTDNTINIRRRLIAHALKHNHGKIISAFDETNSLISAAFFLIRHNRIINLAPASNEKGKELSAMFLIVDQIIQAYSGKSFIFDFEGSDIEGVARFYKGFGSQKSNYPQIRINRLNLPFFKK